MAGGTLAVRDRLEERNRAGPCVGLKRQLLREVALGAGHLAMSTGKRIVGARVIELRSRLPPFEVMAGRAVLAQGASVDVLMASGTGLLEPQPPGPRAGPLGERRRRSGGKRRIVAIPAFRLGVLTHQGPPGLSVIELLGTPARPFDQREIPPSMVGMALGTGCVRVLRMEAAVLLNQPAHVLVAGEATLRHRFLAPAVARGAFERPLQLGVRLGQRSRRDLGRDHGALEEGESQPDDQPPVAMGHQSHVAPTETTTAT